MAAAEAFPIVVRQIRVRKLRGRIVASATIVNTGNAPVRSTTGLFGLSRGSDGNRNRRSHLFFSVPSLAPGNSTKVRLKTGLLRGPAGRLRELQGPHMHRDLQPGSALRAGRELLTWRQARDLDDQPYDAIGAGAERDDHTIGPQSVKRLDCGVSFCLDRRS